MARSTFNPLSACLKSSAPEDSINPWDKPKCLLTPYIPDYKRSKHQKHLESKNLCLKKNALLKNTASQRERGLPSASPQKRASREGCSQSLQVPGSTPTVAYDTMEMEGPSGTNMSERIYLRIPPVKYTWTKRSFSILCTIKVRP